MTKKLRLSIIKASIVSFSAIAIFVLLYFIFPPVLRLIPSNPGFRSYSVAWTTPRKTRGCIYLLEEPIWPPKIRKSCDPRKRSNVHLVDFKDLAPSTVYTIIHVDGLRVSFKKMTTLTTQKIDERMPGLPVPAYGKVINPENEYVPGALVLMSPKTRRGDIPVAMITNHQGNYALDIHRLLSQSRSLTIETTKEGRNWATSTDLSENHSPLPQIVVSTK